MNSVDIYVENMKSVLKLTNGTEDLLGDVRVADVDIFYDELRNVAEQNQKINSDPTLTYEQIENLIALVKNLTMDEALSELHKKGLVKIVITEKGLAYMAVD